MDNIGQLLARSFSGGIVTAAAIAGFALILYLIYRLIKLFRPKKVRQEERRILSHRFYKVSGRARAAYLILCLEEVLRFYKQDFSAWERILRALWAITDSSEGDWIGAWQDSVGELLPGEIWTDKSSPLKEMGKIRDLYNQPGPFMLLVNALMEDVYAMVCAWSPGTVAHDPDALRFIDRAEEMMMQFGVPLPSDDVVRFLFSQKDFSLGKPFDGLRLSSLSKGI